MRDITNRSRCTCAFCHKIIEIGDDAIQSQSNGAMKWHLGCEPQSRAKRFGKGMDSDYARETLASEHHFIETAQVMPEKEFQERFSKR